MSWFTLYTTVGTSLPPGAEITTFLAPPFKCNSALALEVKKPVHSKTISTPSSPHGNSSGLRLANTLTSLPFTRNAPSNTSTSPLKRPCVESYFNKCANCLASVKSLIATTSNPSTS